MTAKHKEIKILPYPKKFLYDIVSNVEDYPSFIPWISEVEVLSCFDNTIDYEICVDFKIIKEKFSTRDVFYRYDKIEISLLKGPFSYLYNEWLFEEIDENTTKIEFLIEFQFKSKLLEKMFSNIFIQAQKKILEAFDKKASLDWEKINNKIG